MPGPWDSSTCCTCPGGHAPPDGRSGPLTRWLLPQGSPRQCPRSERYPDSRHPCTGSPGSAPASLPKGPRPCTQAACLCTAGSPAETSSGVQRLTVFPADTRSSGPGRLTNRTPCSPAPFPKSPHTQRLALSPPTPLCTAAPVTQPLQTRSCHSSPQDADVAHSAGHTSTHASARLPTVPSRSFCPRTVDPPGACCPRHPRFDSHAPAGDSRICVATPVHSGKRLPAVRPSSGQLT